MIPFTVLAREERIISRWPKKAKTYPQVLKWWLSFPDHKKDRLYSYYLLAVRMRLCPRDYRVEYSLYHSTDRERYKSRLRKKNRYAFQKRGLVSKYDGRQIHHRSGNVYDNSDDNLEVVSVCEHHRRHGRKCRKSKSTKVR